MSKDFPYRRMVPQGRVYVAGHTGLVGSAIVRRLRAGGYSDLLLRSIDQLDLSRQADVEQFFEQERPEFVVVAAAKVGGILANNTLRADFIRDNLQIQTNVIDAAHRTGVKRLLFLGSSCIYPRDCPQPMREEHLLTGPLEPTNEPYAIAKISGIKLCEALNAQHGTRYVSLMPTNLYGPHDNFDLQSSHVLPALIRKFHEASKPVTPPRLFGAQAGSGGEFLYVDELADAVAFVLERTDSADLLNVGTGHDCTILELAQLIRATVGYSGDILRDTSKPDGTPRKLLDVTRLGKLGWRSRVSLREGIARTYSWYLHHAR